MTMHLVPRLSCGLAALGLCTTLAACNNEPGSGTLRVNYDFVSITSCDEDEETVIDITVELGDAVAEETVPCDNAGGEIVLSAPAGTYDVVVQGIDDEGDAVLDNLGGVMTDDRVEVIGGDDKSFDVTLDLIPAQLEVYLLVRNPDSGVPAQCVSDQITIKGLRVEAWSFAGQLKSHDFELCEFSDFLPVPDEDREINGRLFDRVVLQPLDAGGADVGPEVEVEFAEPIGAGKSVQVSLDCQNDDCMVTVLGGDPGNTTDDPTGGDPTGGDPTGGGESDTSGGTTGGADSTGGG